jgi:hypothetical protein
MMRGEQPILVLALAVILAGAATAVGAGTVRFFVDATLVGELPYDELPVDKPLLLAGRSGSVGVDQNSGLFDNVVVELFDSGTICTDSFECYEIAYWATFGTPAPVIVATAGASAPCLMSTADTSHESGVYSQQLYDWSPGFRMEADLFVDAASVDHCAALGVSSVDVPSDPGGSDRAVGATWMTTKSGEVILRLNTDLEEVDVHGPSVGSWHHIVIETTDSVSIEKTHWGFIKARHR